MVGKIATQVPDRAGRKRVAPGIADEEHRGLRGIDHSEELLRRDVGDSPWSFFDAQPAKVEQLVNCVIRVGACGDAVNFIAGSHDYVIGEWAVRDEVDVLDDIDTCTRALQHAHRSIAPLGCHGPRRIRSRPTGVIWLARGASVWFETMEELVIKSE